jgi:hypothetical protein
MIFAFFLFSGPQAMNEYTINDLFEVKQGKQILDKAKQKAIEKIDLNTSKIKVLTMNSINFDDKSIDPGLLSDYNLSSAIGSNNILTANSYIVNRVGKNRGMSLLDSDFDFEKNSILASHHFIFLQPRKIVLDNLAFFHSILDMALVDLINEKVANNNSKLQYLTVKEIQNRKITLSSDGFNDLAKSFVELYGNYKAALKTFNSSKQKLEEFKREFVKKTINRT